MKKFTKHATGSLFAVLFSCAALCAAPISAVVVDYAYAERPPVNTMGDVTESFSKNDFVAQLQETLRTGTVEDALVLYDSIPAEYASDSDLQFLKASLYVSIKQLNEAKAICTTLNAQDPSNIDVIEMLAYIAKLQGNTAERNRQLKVLLAKDSYNAAANIELAEDAYIQKNYKQARVYYQKALVHDPENQDALFGLGRSNYYLGSKDPSKDAEAEANFKKILEQDPSYAPAYSYLGKLAAAGSKYKVASSYILQAISIDGSNPEYYMDYGMYERQLGHFENAEKAFTTAIDLQPDYFLAYAYRAGVYDEQNKFTQALQDYQSVIACNPDYYFAYESLGVLAIHEKQWATARQAFLKCVEKDKTGNVSYPLMVTYCYYMEGNKLEAKKFSDKVLRKMDRNSIDYAMLRVFHDEAGEMPIPQKITALDNNNQKGKMYYYLGLFYEMFGSMEFAKENYSKVVNMQAPMIFEYRLAEWALGINTDATQ